MIIFYSLIAAWYLIGMVSFIYWWTSDHDLTLQQIPIIFFAGFIGPIAFMAGWIIHGKNDKVLLKKRG